MKHFFPLVSVGRLVGLLMLLLVGPVVWAQAPAWQTAIVAQNAASPSSYSYVRGSTTDASGNVYVVGEFFGTVTFGAAVLTSTTGAVNNLDGFVAKWSPISRSFTWAVSFGGAGADAASAVAVTGSSVYLTGYFNSITASFGSFTLANANTSSGSLGDGFVAKLTDTGSSVAFVWVNQLGGSLTDLATAVAVRGTNVYVTGLFASPTMAVGSIILANAGGTAGTPDGFVARFVDAGQTSSATWALGMGGTGADRANGIALSGTGMVVVGDFTSFSAQFGTTVLSSAGDFDVFVARITDAGTSPAVDWAVRAGGTGTDVADAVAVSGNNVYVTGGFASPAAVFGPATLAVTPLSATGNTDVFVAKLTDAGPTTAFVWAQQSAGTSNDRARTIAVNGANLYIAGSFAVPDTRFGTTTLTNAGTGTTGDIFVAKLLDGGVSGSFAWARQAGGINGEAAYALALNGTTILVAGGVGQSAAFGTTVVNTLPGSAGFLASLTDPALLATATTQSALSFSLAPNPAHTATTVQLPTQPGSPTATLSLLDALGRRVKTETVTLPATGLRHELNVAGLPAGLYALQVQAGAATATRKLVVE